MPKNTDKGSSKLVLSNGNSIDIDKLKAERSARVRVNPISGKFEVAGCSDIDNSKVGRTDMSYSGKFNVKFEYQFVDYEEQFEEKRQALEDMVRDGDGFTKEEIRDLVMVGNKAVWQESRDEKS